MHILTYLPYLSTHSVSPIIDHHDEIDNAVVAPDTSATSLRNDSDTVT